MTSKIFTKTNGIGFAYYQKMPVINKLYSVGGINMFSKQLIIKAVNFLPNTSHDELNNELISLDLNSKEIKLSGSISNKKQAIQTYLLSNPNAVDNYGDKILLRMMNSVVKQLLNNINRGIDEFDNEKSEFKSDKNFYRYLLLDGYSIDFDGACIEENIANYAQVVEKNDNIVNMLNKYSFETALGHYNQAKSSYLGGNYAALNAQLRTFVETIFWDMAKYIKNCEQSNQNIENIQVNSSHAPISNAMSIFAKCNKPILYTVLNEWDSNANSYFPAFWRRLHPYGCHPGLPDLSEAVYKFQLVVINIELLINRFQSNYPLN